MSYILQPSLQVLPKPLRIDPGRAVSTEQRRLLLLLHQNSLREVPWPPPPLPPAQPHTLPLPLLCTASPLSSRTPLRTTHSSVRYTVYSLLMFIVVFVDCVTAAVPCLLASLTFSWQSFYLLFFSIFGCVSHGGLSCHGLDRSVLGLVRCYIIFTNLVGSNTCMNK